MKLKSVVLSSVSGAIITIALSGTRNLTKTLASCLTWDKLKTSFLNNQGDNMKIVLAIFAKLNYPKHHHSGAISSSATLNNPNPSLRVKTSPTVHHLSTASPSRSPFTNTHANSRTPSGVFYSPGGGTPGTPSLGRDSFNYYRSGISSESFFQCPVIHRGKEVSYIFGKVLQERSIEAISNASSLDDNRLVPNRGSTTPSAKLNTAIRKLIKNIPTEHVDTVALCAGLLGHVEEVKLRKKLVNPTKRLKLLELLQDLVFQIMKLRSSVAKALQLQHSVRPSSGSAVGNHHKIRGVGGKSSSNLANQYRSQASPGNAGSINFPEVPAIGTLKYGSGGETPNNITTPGYGSTASAVVVSPAEKAKEEFMQMIGHIYPIVIEWFRLMWMKEEIKAQLSPATFVNIVRQMLFLQRNNTAKNIPITRDNSSNAATKETDKATTEHDKDCFALCNEGAPMHCDVFLGIVSLAYDHQMIDSKQAIDIMYDLAQRGMKGQMIREKLWTGKDKQARMYVDAGGLFGIEMNNNNTAFIKLLFHLVEIPKKQELQLRKKSLVYYDAQLYWKMIRMLVVSTQSAHYR